MSGSRRPESECITTLLCRLLGATGSGAISWEQHFRPEANEMNPCHNEWLADIPASRGIRCRLYTETAMPDRTCRMSFVVNCFGGTGATTACVRANPDKHEDERENATPAQSELMWALWRMVSGQEPGTLVRKALDALGRIEEVPTKGCVLATRPLEWKSEEYGSSAEVEGMVAMTCRHIAPHSPGWAWYLCFPDYRPIAGGQRAIATEAEAKEECERFVSGFLSGWIGMIAERWAKPREWCRVIDGQEVPS